jgi:site-specific recombinase XerD
MDKISLVIFYKWYKLANNGKTSIKTVQNLLGHSSVHTTLGYVHPNMDDMRRAVSLL